jgi:hypothetical protein
LLAADSSGSDSVDSRSEAVEAASSDGFIGAAAGLRRTSLEHEPASTAASAGGVTATRPTGLLLAGYGSDADSQDDDSDGSGAGTPSRAQASAAVGGASERLVSAVVSLPVGQSAAAAEPPEAIRTAVSKLCEYAARVGPAFISLVSAKEAANPRFAFLQAWSPWHAYFQAQLALVLPQQPPAAVAQPDTAPGVALAGVAAPAAAETTVGTAPAGLLSSASAVGSAAAAGVSEAAPHLPQHDVGRAHAEAEPLPDRIAWEEVAPTAGQSAGHSIADGAPAAAGEGGDSASQALPAAPLAAGGLDGAGVRALLLEAATVAARVVRSKPKITVMVRSAAPQKSDAAAPPAGSVDGGIVGTTADGLAAPAPASCGPGVASAAAPAFPVVDSSAPPPGAPAADSEAVVGATAGGGATEPTSTSGSQALSPSPRARSAIEPAPPAAAHAIKRARAAPPFLCTTSLPPPRLSLAARLGVSSATAASLAHRLMTAPVRVASPQLASDASASGYFPASRDAGGGDGDVVRWGVAAPPPASVSAPSAALPLGTSSMTGASGAIRDAAFDARPTVGVPEVASAASATADACLLSAGEESGAEDGFPDPGDWIDSHQGYTHYSSRAVAMALCPELFAVSSERRATGEAELCGAELALAVMARSCHPSSLEGAARASVTDDALTVSADTAGHGQSDVANSGAGAEPAAGYVAMPGSHVVGAETCMPPSHSTADAPSSSSSSRSQGHVAAASPRGSSDSERGGTRSQRIQDRAGSSSMRAPSSESKSARVSNDDRRSRSRGSGESQDRGRSDSGAANVGVTRPIDVARRAGDARRDERRGTNDADREQRNNRRQTSRERHPSYRVSDSRCDTGRSAGGAVGGAHPLRDSRPWDYGRGDRSRLEGARAGRYSRPRRERDDRFLDDDGSD